MSGTANGQDGGRTCLFILICMHARPRLERAQFSTIVSMTYDGDKTHSVHATSCPLFSLLSVPSFESFHLAVLLSQHRLRRRRTRIPHSNRRWYALWSRRLEWRVTWVRGMLLIRDPLHRARTWTLVRWKLLGTGPAWSPRHPTSHTTRHATGKSTWDIALHTGRDPSRYTTRNIPDWRATGCTWQNLLAGFLSSDVYRRKVGGLEGVSASGLIECGIYGYRLVGMGWRCALRIENTFRTG